MEVSFKQSIEMHRDAVNSVEQLEPSIMAAAELLADSTKNGGCVYWMGNGGSAADAQHYAAELMVRYTRNRAPIASIALTTDTSLLTAHSNDYEYSTVFCRQIEALAKNNDVVVGISTSGNSENILKGLVQAKQNGAKTIALLGRDGGKIKDIADISLIVGSDITAHIQEGHLIIGHFLCDYVESQFS